MHSRRGLATRPDPNDDARLITRIAGRDRRAFDDLYRRYHPRLTRFLINLVRRPQLVEEVLNDTMLVVWNRPDGYNGASKVSTWILAIAYRKAQNALRRLDEPMADKHAETRASAEAGPEQDLGRRQIQEVLLTAINHLSADHRAVVDLTYFHELKYGEIAEIMGCPVDTVKTRMFHARRHMRRAMTGRLSDWL